MPCGAKGKLNVVISATTYGAGLSYTYFMNGINKSGTTFGVSIHATNSDFEDSYGGFFQVGYQF